MSRLPQEAKPTRISRRERMQRAMELRKNGGSYEAIRIHLGVSKSTAHALVKAALAELNEKLSEDTAEVRRLSLERLDVATVHVMRRIAHDDMNAVQKLVLIEERRAKLLGLDAPQKVAETTPEGEPVKRGLDLSKLTDEELETLQAIYEKYETPEVEG